MKTKRILVVDDKEEDLYLLRALLQGHGYKVDEARHGAEALATARQSPPDLIIADILMPVMDGFTLCREWKNDECLKSIPFVFYTATYTDERDRKFALSLGADRFIVKPEEPDAFMAMIREALEQVESPPAARSTELPNDPTAAIPTEASENEGTAYLKQYNEVLIRKLEAKMEQLERANREMERDIARRKRAEEALEKTATELARSNKDLGHFAYIASHDLQEPLRTIRCFTQMLETRYRGRLDPDADEIVDFIMDGTQRMQSLILDLLAYSKISSSDLVLIRQDSQFALAEALAALHNEMEDAEAIVTHDPLPVVVADLEQLTRVFQCLIGNAIKFRREGMPPRIHVSAKEDERWWLFSVQDNGIGIDQRYAERVFTIFQRLHSASEYPGTGIGLTMCRRIIERHGGTICIGSQPGEGTTVFFTMPRET